MAIYHFETTTDAASNLSGSVAGDLVFTNGYYNAGDGGAAKFVITSSVPSDTVYFNHPISGTSLYLSLIIENGTVNVDQIGAKGDAVIPGPDANSDTTLAYFNDYSGAIVSANSTSTNNKPYFDAALSHAGVKKMVMSQGKIYGVISENNTDTVETAIAIPAGKCLDGCGATLMNIKPGSVSDAVTNSIILGCDYSDVEICNLTLVNNYDTRNTKGSKGIRVQSCEHVYIHDVSVERSAMGIHATRQGTTGALCKNVRFERLKLKKVLTGIQYNNVENGFITDSYISNDVNLLIPPENQNKNHGIYAGGQLINCVFSGLTIEKSGGGNAINRNQADSEQNSNPVILSQNLIFSDIVIDNCDYALSLGHKTRHVVAKNIVATNIHAAGILLCDLEDINISNCRFFGGINDNAASGIFIPRNLKQPDENDHSKDFFDLVNYNIKNITISDCEFSFNRHFISIEVSRKITGDNIFFNNCHFMVKYPQLASSSTPTYAEGIISNMAFNNCTFESDGFSESHFNNGVFFYFCHDSDRAEKVQWSFNGCKFLNNGSSTVNSPILSNSGYDDIRQTIYCSITNCVMKGFRWTLRVALTTNTSSSTSNPAFSGYPLALAASAAISDLNTRKRFLSHNNIYTYDTLTSGINDTYYKHAEEYGA